MQLAIMDAQSSNLHRARASCPRWILLRHHQTIDDLVQLPPDLDHQRCTQNSKTENVKEGMSTATQELTFRVQAIRLNHCPSPLRDTIQYHHADHC